MKKALFKIICFCLLLPSTVLAVDPEPRQNLGDALPNAKVVADKYMNTDKSLDIMLSDIIRLVLSVLGAIFIAFIIYAGYLWMTASGNEQKVDKAKDILKQSIIGLAVILGAYAISYFVIIIFGNQINLQ